MESRENGNSFTFGHIDVQDSASGSCWANLGSNCEITTFYDNTRKNMGKVNAIITRQKVNRIKEQTRLRGGKSTRIIPVGPAAGPPENDEKIAEKILAQGQEQWE